MTTEVARCPARNMAPPTWLYLLQMTTNPSDAAAPRSPWPLPLPEWQVLAERQALREAVLSRNFLHVEALCKQFEDLWWLGDAQGLVYEYLTEAGFLFDSVSVPPATRLALLNEWAACCPQSYHAQLLMASHVFDCAYQIRTSYVAAMVTEERFRAAGQACEIAAVAACRAMNLSPRPLRACTLMLLISGAFGEPHWVQALFSGQTPQADVPHDEEARRIDALALEHLREHALSPIQHYPAELPRHLPPRAPHELEHAKDYWLHCALALKPNDLDTLLSYVHYLAPRWGGGPEEIEKFVRGPLCKELTEPERNALRWIRVQDDLILEDYPDPEETREVQLRKQLFEHWLQRDLRTEERVTALRKYAHFTARSLNDSAAAQSLHVQAIRLGPSTASYRDPGPWQIFRLIMVQERAPDREGAFKQVLENAIRWFDEPVGLTIAAAAAHFGLWGFSRDEALAQTLLDRAAQLEPTIDFSDGDTFTPLGLLRKFWDGGWHDESLFLTRELARRGVYRASSVMYDIYRGSPTYAAVAHLVDPLEATHWLDRGVAEGVPSSLYNKAFVMEEDDLAVPANFERCTRLYGEAWERGVSVAIGRLAQVVRRFGPPQQQRQMVAQMKELTASYDDEVAGSAYAEVALAYKSGAGVPKSEYVAMQWLDQGKALFPDHASIEWSDRWIYGDGGALKSMWIVLRAFFGARLGVEHLPPSADSAGA